jgi:hypothetical protein
MKNSNLCGELHHGPIILAVFEQQNFPPGKEFEDAEYSPIFT